MNESTSSSPSSTATSRNEVSFNEWKYKIQSDERFENVFNLATDRQRCAPEEVKSNSLWSKYMFTKPFAPTTLKSYKSRLVKIIYCLVDEDQLKNVQTYSLDREFTSIIRQQPLMEPEELCRRMLELRSVTKETLQLTINFYTNAMNIREYKIPKLVLLPRDKELRNFKNNNRNVVLHNKIHAVLECIERKIKHFSGTSSHDRGPLRGAIVFCIMLGTGMRINEARHLTLHDLNTLIRKGRVRSSVGLKRKKSRASNALNCIKRKPLELAREMYVKNPKILNISKNTSTPFKDFKRLLCEAGVKTGLSCSNMIRHYLMSKLYNNGMPLQKVARLMNHDTPASTRHYINKFDVGVDESDHDDDDDDDDDYEENNDDHEGGDSDNVNNGNEENNDDGGGGGGGGEGDDDEYEYDEIDDNIVGEAGVGVSEIFEENDTRRNLLHRIQRQQQLSSDSDDAIRGLFGSDNLASTSDDSP
jgi:integrase